MAVLSVLAATSISVVAGNSVHAAESAVTISAVKSAEVEEGFKDMNNSHWAYDSVLFSQAKGIVSGYPDGTFKPNKEVSESEFLAMMMRAFSGNVDTKANSGGEWSDIYYEKATQLRYPVTGKRNEPINRTKVAELVSSSQGVNYNGNNAIIFMLGNKLANGKTSASVEGYKGSDLLTRAEAVQFLRNVIDMVDVVGLMERPSQASNPADLPKLPEAKPVENTNAKLETLRKQVEKEMAKDGYTVRASSHEFSLILVGSDGKGFAAYSDYRATGGVRTAQVEKVIKSDLTIDVGKLNALTRMIQAVGIPVDQKFTDAMIEVIDGANEKTVKYDTINVRITAVGTTVLITID